MQPPEPCIGDFSRCWSPMACNGWGYCRLRNAGYGPTSEEQRKFRTIAAERKAKLEPNQ